MCESVQNKDFGKRPLSFVRRSSRLDARLQKAWDSHRDAYLLDLPDSGHTLGVDPSFRFDCEYVRKIWGSENPLVVEIGTGQGENIVAAAKARPDRNFLAIEVYTPGVAHTMLLSANAKLENFRIAQVNAPELFAVFQTGLLDEVWTYFPDPWPKTKHHKRRIVCAALADEIRRSLREKGAWRIATDIEDYALHVHEVMDFAQKPAVECLEADFAAFEKHGGRIETEESGEAGTGESRESRESGEERSVEDLLADFDKARASAVQSDPIINGFENAGDCAASIPLEHVSKGTAHTAQTLEHAWMRESRRFSGRILTNFERKGIEAGRTIHDFTYISK